MHELLKCMSLGFGNPQTSTLHHTLQYHYHAGVQEHRLVLHRLSNHKKAEKLSSYIATDSDDFSQFIGAITETTHYVF